MRKPETSQQTLSLEDALHNKRFNLEKNNSRMSLRSSECL